MRAAAHPMPYLHHSFLDFLDDQRALAHSRRVHCYRLGGASLLHLSVPAIVSLLCIFIA
ncbi:hypothetical protein BD311DRAFT_763455 [Dichomitus squalens]|uniref:Uncharacterized protein n=1 Tax=Dichomitus squalens TaxID=114155 RepID=A0A4Q9MF75_9APHY|nr:hypothetical protein BD311DRAFT_763455 [Dichomitus squalens]